MLTLTLVFRAAIVLLATSSIVACSTHHHSPQPADRVATHVLGPIADWNPVSGTKNEAGSAASGTVKEQNGHISTNQTFEVWTSSGAPLPADVRRRHDDDDFYRQPGNYSRNRPNYYHYRRP